MFILSCCFSVSHLSFFILDNDTSAVDYSDINELADDEDVNKYKDAMASLKAPIAGEAFFISQIRLK